MRQLRLLALVSVILLCIGFLASCGNHRKNDTDTATDPDNRPEQTRSGESEAAETESGTTPGETEKEPVESDTLPEESGTGQTESKGADMEARNGTIEITQLWGADELYARHRIPGMLVTSRGTVIVYNEARTEGSDWSLMDIFMQRSTDGGETFGEKIYLAEGTVRHKTVNNAVMTEGKDGTLHFIFCRNYSIAGEGVFYKYSRDDGLTWSPDREITDATLPEIRNAFAPGPGHGLCLPDGTIMMPVWMVLKSAGMPTDSHGPAVLGILYSKDNGETWQTEGPITEFDGMTSPSESEAVLLSDGRVMLTIRNGYPGFRGYAYSDDGIHFSKPTLDENIKDPCNFGAVTSMRLPDGTYVLLLVNSDWNENDDRIHMTLRASFDDGKTWSVKREFDADNGGYPDIAVGADGTIYILYEHAYGEKMFLVRTDLSWLMGGN